jgi:potassium large conductance calcium-activated channel subfamily M alpha protein 1
MSFVGYDQTPVFAAGEVYLSSLMDSLICQAYYNPELITVLR